MLRQFRLYDNQTQGNINILDFKKALKDFKIDITDFEADNLFVTLSEEYSLDYYQFISLIQVIAIIFLNKFFYREMFLRIEKNSFIKCLIT